MRLLILLFLPFSVAWADSSFVVVREMPLYAASDTSSQVLLRLKPGEFANFTTASEGQFYHAWVRRGGKWRYGFLQRAQVDEALMAPANRKPWSFGLGADTVYYWQGGRSFQTDDQVQYNTTQYRGTALAPTLNFQFWQRDFWRLSLGYKQVTYKTQAAAALIGATPEDVVLKQNLLSLVAERAWNPLSILPDLYCGAGVEVAKATSVSLSLGGVPLPTTSEDNPVYLGLIAFVGDQWKLDPSWSIFLEGRYEMVFNQSPSINAFGASLGVLYWP